MYVTGNAKSQDSEEIVKLVDYFKQNRKAILDNADMSVMNELYNDPNKKVIAQEMRQRQAAWAEVGLALLEGVVEGVAEYQVQEAQRLQLEAAQRKAQLQEEYNRSMEIAMQNRAKQAAQLNAMQNSSYTTTSSTPLYSSANQAQRSSSNMQTSDINNYMATQMSNNAYGTQATQEAMNQQRQNNYSNSANGGYGGQVIQAVMSNGRAIKIQVRSGRVVAYSTGMQGTTQNWASTEGAILRTTGVGNRLEAEYSYKTSFFMGNSNVTVYFDM